jgi:hypothetical protein
VIRSILAGNPTAPVFHAATGHTGPGPEVVRTILGEPLPATAAGAAQVAQDAAAPVVTATVSDAGLAPSVPSAVPGLPVETAAPAHDAGQWSPPEEAGHVALRPIEPALAEVVRRAAASGAPFSLVLARPGAGATPGVPVPMAPAAAVADLAAALSCALEPAHSLYGAGPSHLAVIVPGSRQRDAVALAQRAADGGAPTFTWVAVRYPRDARTASGLLQLAAQRLDGIGDGVVGDAAGAWWRSRAALTAIGAAAALVVALVLMGGGKTAGSHRTADRQGTGGAISSSGGSASTGGSSTGSAGSSTAGTGGSGGGSSTGTTGHGVSGTGTSGLPVGTSGGGGQTGSNGSGTTGTTGSNGGTGSQQSSGTQQGSTPTPTTPTTTVPTNSTVPTTTAPSGTSSTGCTTSGGGGLLGGIVGGLVGGLLGGGSTCSTGH